MTSTAPERMKTRAEVAQIVGVSEKTLRGWERAGTGPEVVRFSRRTARYPADALARFLQAREGAARCA